MFLSILHILWYLSEDTQPILKPEKYVILNFSVLLLKILC
jgi:hypothetical protein